MLSKITFVMLMGFLACFVVMLSWFGLLNGHAWARRKDYIRHVS